jgi:transposase
MLQGTGLLLGRALAIDASTMEANAALRSIVRRDTNESDASYVAGLAKAAGEPDPVRSARARFDRKRPKRTISNQDWESPADPDAKIAKLKDGRTALAYQPEHVVDLDTGAIVAATVQSADLSDHATSTETLVQAIGNLDHLGQSSKDFTVVADQGSHLEAVIAGRVAAEIETCISEPKLRGSRRLGRKSPLARKALDRNRSRVRSAYGKKLLRRRGETVERTFAHTLASGGMRRAWLRGRDNAEKRCLVQATSGSKCGDWSASGRRRGSRGLPRPCWPSLRVCVGLWPACGDARSATSTSSGSPRSFPSLTRIARAPTMGLLLQRAARSLRLCSKSLSQAPGARDMG